MDVFGIFIAVSSIVLIVTLAVMNIIKDIKKSQEYKPYTPYSKYYVAEKAKDLELASKVLSDKPKSKALTNTYDAWKNQDSQDLFDTGKMSPVVGVRCSSPVVDDDKTSIKAHNSLKGCVNKYLGTVPSHKTRVALRKKRQRKK